jgi:serine/threonine protein kinase
MDEQRSERRDVLPEGTIILEGQYCVLQLLHRRPRVNLYLGKCLVERENVTGQNDAHEMFVAIRELVLTGLAPQTCVEIEQAAFEEFVSPFVLSSPRLPGAIDFVRVEGGRHYLVMQLNGSKSEHSAFSTQHVTLARLLLNWRQWPVWVDVDTSLSWGTQLCRIIARLHRSGVVLGDLDPTTVLVDGEGISDRAPVLLVSWPPAPQFWPHDTTTSVERYRHLFPFAQTHISNAFAAPEALLGDCNAGSDVYSLGAILYLLLTRYAPIAAGLRLGLANDVDDAGGAEKEDTSNSIALIPPQRLNKQITGTLSEILLRALAIDPEQRYATVFELTEAVEAVVEGWH